MRYLLALLLTGCACQVPQQTREAITFTEPKTSDVEFRLRMLEDKVEALRPFIVKDLQ